MLLEKNILLLPDGKKSPFICKLLQHSFPLDSTDEKRGTHLLWVDHHNQIRVMKLRGFSMILCCYCCCFHFHSLLSFLLCSIVPLCMVECSPKVQEEESLSQGTQTTQLRIFGIWYLIVMRISALVWQVFYLQVNKNEETTLKELLMSFLVPY